MLKDIKTAERLTLITFGTNNQILLQKTLQNARRTFERVFDV